MLDEFSTKVLDSSLQIVEKAHERNIVVRILGALAVYLNCSKNHDAISFFRKAERLEGESVFTDVDLIAYSRQRKQLVNLMRELDYLENKMINSLFGHKRLIFFKDNVKVDIFFDKLEFSHDVIFGNEPGKGRLEIDYPTISLADLILEKLQIHAINRKDIIDLIAIFMTYDFHQDKKVDIDYIAKTLCDDWGFWYDAHENLNKVSHFTLKFKDEGVISEGNFSRIMDNIQTLRKSIDSNEKTKNWIKRSKVGTSKPWYREVGDLNI